MKPNPDVIVKFNDYDLKALIAAYAKEHYPNLEVIGYEGLPVSVTLKMQNPLPAAPAARGSGWGH